MAKGPMQDLGQEHGAIVLMLTIMEKIAEKLEANESIEIGDLHKVTEFLRNFTDKCHHGKEEEILFPVLVKEEKYKVQINEFLGEHMTGRDYIRGMAESADNIQAGNPDAYHAARNIRGYVQLLKEHVRKENLMFAMLESEMPAEVQTEIEERFVTLEREVIGEGKSEVYQTWVKELADIYLT